MDQQGHAEVIFNIQYSLFDIHLYALAGVFLSSQPTILRLQSKFLWFCLKYLKSGRSARARAKTRVPAPAGIPFLRKTHRRNQDGTELFYSALEGYLPSDIAKKNHHQGQKLASQGPKGRIMYVYIHVLTALSKLFSRPSRVHQNVP